MSYASFQLHFIVDKCVVQKLWNLNQFTKPDNNEVRVRDVEIQTPKVHYRIAADGLPGLVNEFHFSNINASPNSTKLICIRDILTVSHPCWRETLNFPCFSIWKKKDYETLEYENSESFMFFFWKWIFLNCPFSLNMIYSDIKSGYILIAGS